MNNKEVQQKLCTEPKDTIAETIQFSIPYEEGAMCQQSFDKLDKPNKSADPNELNNISTGIKRWGPTKKCFRCEAPFSPQHLKECKAMGITCIKCGKKGHLAKYVVKPKAQETSRKVEKLSMHQHKELKHR